MLEDQKENLLFSKIFGVSPKYKFKLTLAHKELWKNERPYGIIVMNLVHCGDYDINLSMTTLLTHTVAHSSKPSFRPKTNNQSLKKFLSFVLS